MHLRFVIVVSLVGLCGCGSTTVKDELTAEEVWELKSPSLLRVEAEGLNGEVIQGTGFFCRLDGSSYVLTNRHVVKGAKFVKIGNSRDSLVLSDGYKISLKHDIAIISVPKELDVVPIPIRESDIKVGEQVYVLGYPLGLGKSITTGIVSSTVDSVIQFDASISSGNSGGPLIDRYGDVIGIVTAGISSHSGEIAQNLNFAINCRSIPDIKLFKDPVGSFYESWVELIEVENDLIKDIIEKKVFELNDYLVTDFFLEGVSSNENEFFDDFSAEQKEKALKYFELLRSYNEGVTKRAVLDVYEDIDAAVNDVSKFYEVSMEKFKKIPLLFDFVIDNSLREEFFDREMIGARVVGLNIKDEDFVSMVEASMSFVIRKYTDAKFVLNFLWNKRKDSDSYREFARKSQSYDGGTREDKFIDYERLLKQGIDGELRAFSLALSSFPNYRTRSSVDYKDPYEWVTETGGLEGHISEMFSRIAIKRFTESTAGSALRAIEEEVKHKAFPSYRIRGICYACLGNYDKAWEDHKLALTNSLDEIDPWALRKGKSNKLIFREFMIDFDYEMSEPIVQQRIDGFRSYFKSKPFYKIAQSEINLKDIVYWEHDDLSVYNIISYRSFAASKLKFDDYKEYEKNERRMMQHKRLLKIYNYHKCEPRELWEPSFMFITPFPPPLLD